MNKSRGSKIKQKESENLSKTISKYKTIALVDMETFPSSSFEEIKKVFRGSVEFVYTKKVIIYNALKSANKELAETLMSIRMPALALSNEDPFDIANIVMENKTYCRIKAGDTAPDDIVLPAGPTPFQPGPMLSQFSSIGVKTKNEGGKISIISDTTVVKRGEKVPEKIATILSSMDITPKELLLSITIASNGGIMFGRSVLYKSRGEYISEISAAFQRSLSLSISRSILNKYSIKPVIKKIYIGVKFLSVNRNIVSKATIKDIIAKATMQKIALAKLTGGT